MAVKDRTRRFARIGMMLATALGLGAVVGAAGCDARADPVDLRVVDRDTGRVLHVWRHDGRLFVAGEPGARYSLRVTNHTAGRVLVVMSVDGVNILTGETAGYDQRGYVFSPYETYDVTGWRKSDTEVAAFTFAPLPQSYAARTGRPEDVGVIGLAVFDEKRQAPPPEPMESPPRVYERAAPSPDDAGPTAQGRAAPSPLLAPMAAPPPPPPAPAGAAMDSESARQAMQDEKLGTGHGAREWSAVETVDFERATTYPRFTRQIEYDTYANLVAAGVIVPYAVPDHRPRPFPTEPGYVPDPPG